MRYLKRKLFACFALLAIAMCLSANSVSALASDNADSIVKTAFEKMRASVSISYTHNSVRNYTDDNGSGTWYVEAACVSDSKIDYGVYISNWQSTKAWIGYSIKGKIYRKAYDSDSFTSYDRYDYEEKTNKKEIEYTLVNLKDLEITNISKDYYTISGKPTWNNPESREVMLTINKKSGKLVKIKYLLAKKTSNYLNSKKKFTVTGGSKTYSNIGYGDMGISLPDELDGR